MQNEKKHIFLVDDSILNLYIGKTILTKKYIVTTAPSVEKMLNLLKERKPDMILLDVYMPEIDGFEAMRILKSKPETKDIPVIFLTVCIEVCGVFAWLCLNLGVVGYITKPFNPFILFRRIDNFLENTFMTKE